jgi:hypothetical protein
MSNKEQTLENAFQFAFGMKDIEGTFIRERIRGFISEENRKLEASSYKPRSGKVGAN